MKKNKVILVTGGAGFIGSHVCEKLIRTDHKVLLLDRFKQSKHEKRKRINLASFSPSKNLTVIDADINNKKEIHKIFKNHSINTVLHLAAQADVPVSINSPSRTVQTNLLGTTLIFEEAAKQKVSHIVYASSSLVYGKNSKPPMKENDHCDSPTSPYAASMRAVELTAYAHYNNYKIPITGLRLFPVYGPRMRENLVIPVLVKRISQGKPIIIYGDGKQKRSYCCIEDLVDGIISAFRKPNGYQLINLGHPSPISLIYLITLIEKLLDRKAKRRHHPTRPDDIPLLYPDLRKAKKLLDWQPQIDIEDGLKRYISPTITKALQIDLYRQ